MSTVTSSHCLVFSQLGFSDLERYRPGLPTSWPRVLIQCIGHPGMVASIILRAQQMARRAGRNRLEFVLRSVGMYLLSADFVPGMDVGPGLMMPHPKIGRAHVCTPVTNAPLVCRPLPDTIKHKITTENECTTQLH